jgi:hypothetical protein
VPAIKKSAMDSFGTCPARGPGVAGSAFASAIRRRLAGKRLPNCRPGAFERSEKAKKAA